MGGRFTALIGADGARSGCGPYTIAVHEHQSISRSTRSKSRSEDGGATFDSPRAELVARFGSTLPWIDSPKSIWLMSERAPRGASQVL